MAENTNVKSEGINGALRFMDYRRQDILTIGATTGIPVGSYNQSVSTVVAATSLTAIHCGKLINCTTDAVVITLPDPITAGKNYNIINTASDGGALLQIKTNAASTYIAGYGSLVTTSIVIANTKATQRYGDSISLIATGSSTWFLKNVVGTWLLTTAT